MNETKVQRLLEGSVLIGTDWPMSLGYRVCVLTDSPRARPEHHASTKVLRDLLAHFGGTGDCSGMSMRIDTTGLMCYLVAIFCSEGGAAVRDGRLVELVAHECSHVIDFVEEVTHAQLCTETRAYTLDWLVGRTCGAVLPHLYEPTLLTAGERNLTTWRGDAH